MVYLTGLCRVFSRIVAISYLMKICCLDVRLFNECNNPNDLINGKRQ